MLGIGVGERLEEQFGPGEKEEWCKDHPKHPFCKGTTGEGPGDPDPGPGPVMQENKNWPTAEKNQKLFESLMKKWCK
jgi:hypothetical protein